MFDFNQIEKKLLNFEKPGRYIGAELGIPKKDFINSKVRFAISYPDIYEVGMSNKGIQIIYQEINDMPDASCERVFSPWIDFEDFLIKNDLPLYSLETKTPLNNFNILGVSLQYELLFSNFLNLLKLGKITVFSKDRKEDEPIVIAGGPAVVNPAPYSPFVDLFLIGEGEEIIKKFIEKYTLLKELNDRHKIIEELSKMESIYSPVYSKKTVKKNIYYNFSGTKQIRSYILPNIDVVQNKLVVEIMRGCPNKCRFCLAGVYYKPSREKKIEVILDEIEEGIGKVGSNEVTLSSLSSSDYGKIIELTDAFNSIYKDDHISFSLPSIRVETFDPVLLEKISSVRKSGLTFAIESGSIDGQRIINKEVLLDKMLSIVDYAVNKGWRLIKLYFMIGLPFIENEVKTIIEFVDNILLNYTKLLINLNVTVFVPKSHTVFQFEKQLSHEESILAFNALETYYNKSRVSIKKHDPLTSYLEGFVARGDEKVGMAFYDAFLEGAKFDGWREFFNFEFYKKAFLKHDITYEKYLSKKEYTSALPWDKIDIGFNKKILKKELEEISKKELTQSCKNECDSDCNLCNGIDKKNNKDEIYKVISKNNLTDFNKEKSKYLLKFSKTGLMRFVGHIDLINYFERIFLRSKLKPVFSEGFNPRPRMQFSGALTLGIESVCELLEFYTIYDYPENFLLKTLKIFEHQNFAVEKIKKIDLTNKRSLSSDLFSISYSITFKKEYYKIIKEKADCFRKNKVKYTFSKKNREFNGVYNDFLLINELYENKLFFDISTFANIPKVFKIIDDIFGDIDFYIIRKENILVKENNDILELYDFIR